MKSCFKHFSPILCLEQVDYFFNCPTNRNSIELSARIFFSPCRYDIIFGRDVLRNILGMQFDFEENLLSWDGAIVAMRPFPHEQMGAPNSEDLNLAELKYQAICDYHSNKCSSTTSGGTILSPKRKLIDITTNSKHSKGTAGSTTDCSAGVGPMRYINTILIAIPYGSTISKCMKFSTGILHHRNIIKMVRAGLVLLFGRFFFASIVCVIMAASGQAGGVGGRQPPYEWK